ncbi:MAG: hypothetical protein MHPSP_004039, partial [Paramarteilia canceri]
SISSGHGTSKKNNSSYTFDEDKKIFDFLERFKDQFKLKGQTIYKYMESNNVVEGRSYQSIRNRVTRHLANNLEGHTISKDLEMKIREAYMPSSIQVARKASAKFKMPSVDFEIKSSDSVASLNICESVDRYNLQEVVI